MIRLEIFPPSFLGLTFPLRSTLVLLFLSFNFRKFMLMMEIRYEFTAIES